MVSRNKPNVWADDSARLQCVSVNDLVSNIDVGHPYGNESVPADGLFPDCFSELKPRSIGGSRQSGTLGDGDDLLVYLS